MGIAPSHWCRIADLGSIQASTHLLRIALPFREALIRNMTAVKIQCHAILCHTLWYQMQMAL